MSDLKIVLTHADAREERTVTTGTKAWELYADDPTVIAARVGGALRDLAYELQDGDEVEGVAIDSTDGHDILRHSTAHVMAQAVQQLWPDAKLGIGPPVENGFYYDFDVETPFVPEDLDKIETAMRKIIKEGQRFSRRAVSDADALDELQDEPYKIELIGLKGGSARGRRGRRRRGRRRRADHLRQPASRRRAGVEGPLPRPAPAHHQADPGVQADAHRRGVLARQREEQAAPAHLRHRLGEQGGARRAPPPARGGREARPPQARARARPLLLPRGARPRPGRLPPQGRGDPAGDGGLRPAAPHRGGLPVRQHAPHLQGRAVPHLGAPAVLRRHHVSADGARGREVPAQGDELPDAQPHLPVPRPLLPRAAAAPVRVRRGLPLREVRRRRRPHPRARDDPGRLPLLRHPRAGVGRDQAPAELLPRPVPRLRARRLLPRAVDPRRQERRQVPGLRRGLGDRHRGAAECGRRVRARPGRRPRRRGVLRPEDLRSRPRTRSAAPGSSRRCSTTSASRPASGWSTPRPTGRGSSR